jgi:1-deoxy-D-xylulose-5-phosphate synthase
LLGANDAPNSNPLDGRIAWLNWSYSIAVAGAGGENPAWVPNPTHDDIYPVWSPDGAWLAFLRDYTDPYKIRPDGTGLTRFQKAFPERYYDVGICEPHAICFAAALAKGGLRPVACIYSTFLQRSVDQLMHDISLQEGLPVVLCLDRAGLVGDDGPTHHGVFDLAYMRAFPHFILMAPRDGLEAAAMLRWAFQQDKPVALRYPRDHVPAPPCLPLSKGGADSGAVAPIELGRGEILRSGHGVAVLAYGAMVQEAVRAADALAREHGREITVANARFCKPLDGAWLAQLLAEHERVITVEEHQLQNGFGTAILEAASEQGADTRKLVRLGIPDRYVEHGPRGWQLAQLGLDAAGIARAVLRGRTGVLA